MITDMGEPCKNYLVFLSTKNNTLRPFQLWTRARIKILCNKPQLLFAKWCTFPPVCCSNINLPTNALQLVISDQICKYISSRRRPLLEIFTQSIDAIDVTSVTLNCNINTIDVPMFQYLNVQMFQCSNIQMFKCLNVKCQIPNTDRFKFCRSVPLEFLW